MDWSIIVSIYKDEEALNSTLLRSPGIKTAKEQLLQSNYPTVCKAYNDAIAKSTTDILVFTHPDVLLPMGWFHGLERSLEWMSKHDPNWAVMGLRGVAHNSQLRGFSYSVGLAAFLGTPLLQPEVVRTLDEFIFVMRKSAGLKFDENIPGPQSQLCTTDLCLQAAAKGMKSYAIPGFCIHNANGWDYLPPNFWGCYLYIRKKWKDQLPVEAPYATVTRNCMPMTKNSIRGFLKSPKRHRRDTRVKDPLALFEQLRRETGMALA